MKIFKKRIEAFHYEELSQDAKETAAKATNKNTNFFIFFAF